MAKAVRTKKSGLDILRSMLPVRRLTPTLAAFRVRPRWRECNWERVNAERLSYRPTVEELLARITVTVRPRVTFHCSASPSELCLNEVPQVACAFSDCWPDVVARSSSFLWTSAACPRHRCSLRLAARRVSQLRSSGRVLPRGGQACRTGFVQVMPGPRSNS